MPMVGSQSDPSVPMGLTMVGSESDPSMPMVGSENDSPVGLGSESMPAAHDSEPSPVDNEEHVLLPEDKVANAERKRCFSLKKRLQKMKKTKEKIAQGQQVECNQLSALAEYEKIVALLAKLEASYGS